ncbi:hypothetical protein [Natrinema ejinorense]|nr:hypothetical protein [Natrinema ejinorense]
MDAYDDGEFVDLETATDDQAGDFDESALFDFNVMWVLNTAVGLLGGVLFMMGWYGVLAARYVPRVVIGAVATGLVVLGSIGLYWILRDDYPDVFSQLRQIPSRIDD